MKKSLQNHQFKLGDKVRVLRKDEKDVWRTAWYGIIFKLGTTHAYIIDYVKTDANLATFDSCEWVPYESKMLKIDRD